MRIFLAILLCLSPTAATLSIASFQHSNIVAEKSVGPKREPIAWRSPVQDKNFYLLSLLEESPGVRQAIKNDAGLRQIADAKRAKLADAAANCEAKVACHTDALRLQEAEIQAAQQSLRELYQKNDALRHLADVTMRESGMFQRYHAKPGPELLGQAWLDAAKGVNNLIEVYALGRAPRYPAIDAPAYDVKGENYGRLINTAVGVIDDQRDELELFFQPSLRFALSLLEINRRDEAGRLEPLQTGENAVALRRVAGIRWDQYRYSAIVVPGAGTDSLTVNLSAAGKLRLQLAVKRFREGLAPFIIVSGGFVHPNQTPFSEAVEMKKSLIKDFGIDADCILIDPHARHTTTNLRNAARLIYRYGLPFDKRALITTDAYQSLGIESPQFTARCERELGYQPYHDLARRSRFDLDFLPSIESLHADALEPLDP